MHLLLLESIISLQQFHFFLPAIHYVVVILSQYFLWQFCFLLYNPFKYMPNLSHANLKVLYFT